MTFTARTEVINTLFVPAGSLPALAVMTEKAKDRGGYVTLAVSLPKRPKSTGERSQLNRHWGHCEDIADQLSTIKQSYTKRHIDAALRRMAVSEHLRTFLNVDGAEEPIHFSEMCVEEANIVEYVKQRFCDQHDLWLTEYDDTVDPPVPYRSIGGRTRAEMVTFRVGL